MFHLLVAATSAVRLFGAAAPPPVPSSEPVIELPPMIITESSKAPPWLYTVAGNTEYLSRCSAATTRAFIAAQLEIHQLLRVFVPPEFLASRVVPTVSILAPLDLKTASDDAVMREMMRIEEESVRSAAQKARREGQLPGATRLEFLPNQRIDDRDMSAVFTYLDERTFDGERLIVADEFVLSLLVRRTPMLPQWFIEGVTTLYRQASFRRDPITLSRFTWISRDETIALQRDPEARRVLLPGNELFAPDAVLGPENRHAVRTAAWRAQVTLFVRWAIDPANGSMREALWKLAERASREPMTETIFIECFGFGYSDLRDRLSDYLPIAVKDSVRILPGKLPPLPRFEIKQATANQIARLRGEWERLEIPFVRGKHPQFVSRYIEQAQSTLRRAVGRGDRDPQMLAALGLCELDAGDAVAARPWLEQAIATGLVRPRAYYEVARLRWEELTRDIPKTQGFTRTQLEPIMEPLRQAMAQAPGMPEALMLMLEVWLRGSERATSGELADLVDRARLFRRIPGIGFNLALLQFRYDRRAEAAALLVTGISFLGDPAARKGYEQLYAVVSAPRAPDRLPAKTPE
jgi:hypothetical protein